MVTNDATHLVLKSASVSLKMGQFFPLNVRGKMTPVIILFQFCKNFFYLAAFSAVLFPAMSY